ncbi:MAG: LPS-assembly protein LptD [Pseudomonadota bacterium]
MYTARIIYYILAFVLVVSSGAILNFAYAQSGDLLGGRVQSVSPDQPLLLQADTVTYDNKNNVVRAKGNVEIYYNGHALFADNVVYDRNANTLEVQGNVRLKEPSGAIISADQLQLTDDLREGFIRSIQIITADQARFAAESATQINESTTVLKKARFTPCKPCEDQKRSPLWEIRAGQIIHRKDEKQIYFEDATLEFLGLPIAYLPYFTAPDPSVKRRSGFLMPSLTFGEEHTGSSFEMAYFFNLDPTYDFTFNPRITTKQGVLWQGHWRQRLKNGAYDIKFSAIDELDPDNDSPTDSFRGSIETRGLFQLSNWWNFGWDITTETDDTFRRLYDLDPSERTNRVSKIFLIGQSDRNYFEANLFQFSALSETDTSNASSFVHPVIDHSYVFKNPVIGGELSINSNMLSLSRDEGVDTSRALTEVKWRRTFIDSVGQTLTPFFSGRGDVYAINSGFTDPINNTEGDDDFIARATGSAGATYSFPFVNRGNSGSFIVEPIAQVVARPDVDDQGEIPNEDARSLVFDDTLLFDTNKFSGYDRVETGVRANVGFRLTAQLHNGGYGKVVVGQSYHLAGDNSFDEGTGLQTDRSDYVAGAYYEPNSNLTFISQGRFDEEDFTLKRADIYARGTYGPITGSVNYANIDATPSFGIDEREELLAAASLKLSDYWSLFGSIRYNLEADETIQDSLGLKYSDECFVLSVSYNESFINDRDIETDQSVRFSFELKHLGGANFSSDITDDLIADSADNKS